MGKWSLKLRSSSTFHVRLGTSLGDENVRSIAEVFPEWMLKCVPSPVLRSTISVVSIRDSIARPRWSLR
nr:unnamed protein product [Callosobruchus analis]CAI5870195.1 unnamed protein product [Callosobruchus analis]